MREKGKDGTRQGAAWQHTALFPSWGHGIPSPKPRFSRWNRAWTRTAGSTRFSPAPAAIPQHQQAQAASASQKEGTAMGIQASRSGLRTTGSPSPLERPRGSVRASPKHPALRSLQTQLLCSI